MKKQCTCCYGKKFHTTTKQIKGKLPEIIEIPCKCQEKSMNTQSILQEFKKAFKPRRDCSNGQKHIPQCQGCIAVIVEEETVLEQWLTDQLNKAESRGFLRGSDEKLHARCKEVEQSYQKGLKEGYAKAKKEIASEIEMQAAFLHHNGHDTDCSNCGQLRGLSVAIELLTNAERKK